MKHKGLIAIGVLITAFLLGLTGLTMVDANAAENIGQDRLVGVLVTAGHLDLFDYQSYMKDNIARVTKSGSYISFENTSSFQGRLYAKLTERTLTGEKTGETSKIQEYVFAGVPGIPYFSATMPAENGKGSYVVNGSDPAISDGKSALAYSENNKSAALEGIIYVVPKTNALLYYLNPIYQSPDGRVYAISGSGISIGGEEVEGAAFAQTLETSYTITERGVTTTDKFSVKLSFTVMFPPERVIVIQLDSNSTILSREEYVPGKLPSTIEPDLRAAYIIAETYKKGPDGQLNISRVISERKDKLLETFYPRDDGVCVKQFTELRWAE